MDRLRHIFSRPKDQEVSHSSLQKEVVNMLKNWDMRPEPTTLIPLIQEGLTNEDIAQAGKSQSCPTPDMENTLTELFNILPILSMESNAIADIIRSDVSNKTTPVFLGRDAELLYDAYTVGFGNTFPQQKPVLLPGSKGIWTHPRDVFAGQQDEREFLESYGITQEAIQSGKTFLLIDSGFAGHIATRVRESVSRLFGITQEQATTLLPIKLVAKRKSATHPDSLPVANASQLLPDFDPLSEEEYAQIFKRAYYTSNKYTLTDLGFLGHVAIALQIMPHFHGPYEVLKSHNGKRIGIPTPQPIQTDLNKVMRVNDEVINPTAALIVQREVIKYMLKKRKKAQRRKTFSADSEAPDGSFPITALAIPDSSIRDLLQEYTEEAYEEIATGWRRGAQERALTYWNRIGKFPGFSVVEKRNSAEDYHYRCAEYVFTKRMKEIWLLQDITKEAKPFWENPYAFLLSHGYTLVTSAENPQPGDVIAYGNSSQENLNNEQMYFSHFGIYNGHGEVTSKFNMGYVYTHPWDKIPRSYGTHVAFFRKSPNS